jgi:hypothetical protein
MTSQKELEQVKRDKIDGDLQITVNAQRKVK